MLIKYEGVLGVNFVIMAIQNIYLLIPLLYVFQVCKRV